MDNAGKIPLCVDMDGTLLKADTLHEIVIYLLLHHPFFLIYCIWFLFTQGKASFKQKVLQEIDLEKLVFPHNIELMQYLRKNKNTNKTLILVTGANQKLAQYIADELGIFSEVIASDEKVNLNAERKTQLLLARFGDKQFDYAGNINDDLKVWRHARTIYVVNAGKIVEKRVARVCNNIIVCDQKKPLSKSLFKVIRVHQALKNFLLFVPLFLSHSYNDLYKDTAVILAFVCFCLVSFSVYILNDLLDIYSDRRHHSKFKRVIAAGDFPAMLALIIFPILLIVGLIGAFFISKTFFGILLCYYALTLMYSFYLKKQLLIDR